MIQVVTDMAMRKVIQTFISLMNHQRAMLEIIIRAKITIQITSKRSLDIRKGVHILKIAKITKFWKPKLQYDPRRSNPSSKFQKPSSAEIKDRLKAKFGDAYDPNYYAKKKYGDKFDPDFLKKELGDKYDPNR